MRCTGISSYNCNNSNIRCCCNRAVSSLDCRSAVLTRLVGNTLIVTYNSLFKLLIEDLFGRQLTSESATKFNWALGYSACNILSISTILILYSNTHNFSCPLLFCILDNIVYGVVCSMHYYAGLTHTVHQCGNY